MFVELDARKMSKEELEKCITSRILLNRKETGLRKARAVCRGFQQDESSFGSFYAAVPSLVTIRLLLYL